MSDFHAAMVVNHSHDGPARTAIKDGRAYRLPLDEITKLFDDIDQELTKLAEQPDLKDREALEALRSIADFGSSLRQAVQTDGSGRRLDALQAPGPIQLVTKSRNARFPIELLYDGPVPQKARLCTHAAELGDEPTLCSQGLKGTAICPAGFWGLNRVIERFAHDGDVQDVLGAPFALVAIPPERLAARPPPSTFLFGASELFKRAIGAGELETKLARGGRRIFEAPSWDDMPGTVRKNPPDLVLLLAHCAPAESRIARPMLEIGGLFAPPKRFESEHIRAKKSVLGPIVLLFACEAQKVGVVPFLGPVASLQHNGASIVVATSVAIYTNLTADVAAEFLDQIEEMSKRKSWTFGQLMRAVRSEMFTRRPMVLSLTAFGDADWRFQKV